MPALTGYLIASNMRAMATGMPKAQQVGALRAAAILEGAVATASGPYAGKKIVRTQTIPVPPTAAEVRMVSRKAHLLDHDTKSHPILPKKGTYLVFPDSAGTSGVHQRKGDLVFALSVQHPGTQGKHMWEKALVTATPKMAEAINESLGELMLKSFVPGG